MQGALLEAFRSWELLPLAIYACDAEGRVLGYNRLAAELWGRQPAIGDDSELFCGSHKLIFDGREIGRDETPMAHVLRTGQAINGVEGIVLRPDGSRIWAMVHINPVRDETGKIVGAINCFHDITSQKKNESRLREQDQRLHATYERATVGIAEVDAEGNRMRVNEMACQITGRKREELLVGNIFTGMFPEDVASEQPQFEALVRGEIENYTIDKRVVRKDGRVVWITMLASAVRDADGKFLYSVRVFQDITDRKLIADSLAKNEERLLATYENASVSITEVDATGQILRVNETGLMVTGRSREELLKRNIFASAPDTPESRQDVESFRKLVDGEQASYETEKQIVRKDGSLLWVSMSTSAVRDAKGRFLYAVRVMRDINERKLAEARQRFLIDELNHRVKNTLATIQSMAHQTAAAAATPEIFRDQLIGRLIALSRAHDQLSRRNWANTDLFEIALEGLAPFRQIERENVSIQGGPVELTPRAGLILAMVFHELATNAAKFGALSDTTGKLALEWKHETEGGDRKLCVYWKESGGPKVKPPQRRGFGTALVERGIKVELGGAAKLDFIPQGVQCVIKIPVETPMAKAS